MIETKIIDPVHIVLVVQSYDDIDGDNVELRYLMQATPMEIPYAGLPHMERLLEDVMEGVYHGRPNLEGQ